MSRGGQSVRISFAGAGLVAALIAGALAVKDNNAKVMAAIGSDTPL